MDLLQSIHSLPRLEKVKVMEFLWEELTLEEKEFDSPDWHRKALADTEKRLGKGKEKIIDWKKAKQLLRNEFK
ncbi:MAG: hypothetical protein B6I26_04065 [Desulfobacteraceae bacterium 4572_130]|nr:MAG: hypothetical protein B6I26_04065 [Desulfobacteraceae bacterium 4572_130]